MVMITNRPLHWLYLLLMIVISLQSQLFKVDEGLIGGLKMQIGSLMVDTSIKNRLKKYEQLMLEV